MSAKIPQNYLGQGDVCSKEEILAGLLDGTWPLERLSRIRSLELLVHPPSSEEGGEAGDSVNNQCYLCDKASIKISMLRWSEGCWVGEYIQVVGWWYTPNPRGKKPLCWDPSRPCLVCLFILLLICIIFYILYNETINVNKCFPEFCELIYYTLYSMGRGLWELPINSQWVRSTGDNLDL